ncbi:MAG: hypothetical protein Q9165_008188 [Trypethelium subeluteriae]
MASASAKQALQSAANQASRYKKYTVQPQGWGAWISSKLSVDPKRSSGIPLNPQFRNPPPGANDPRNYDDPVTVPAADLAENPYWKRDVRRQYPKLSVVNQGDVVGLLTVGSKASPRDEVLKVGDAGQKQLVEVKEEGQRGLSNFFEKDRGKNSIANILGPGGLPPLPSGLSPIEGGKRYEILKEQSYSTNSRESNHGLNDSRQAHDTKITKLWLTECAHLTCGEHLEGGGAPFHPESKAPRAPCPFCAATKNDQSLRNLYGIRGTSSGDFDAAIPRSFFRVPPIELDADFKDTGAMRFQYLSLMRYGLKALQKVRQPSNNSSLLEKRVTEEAARAGSLAEQVQELQAKVQVLGESEKQLQLWKQKEPQIKHYLGLVTRLAK